MNCSTEIHILKDVCHILEPFSLNIKLDLCCCIKLVVQFKDCFCCALLVMASM
jgi:hypothetical protein